MNIIDYHTRSKHHPRRYAPGPGYLDWGNQPDPFRIYSGAPRIELPLAGDSIEARFNDLRAGKLPPPADLARASIATLFELSLGLSAWKHLGASRWALRCNPSSGNLHPTEGYLVAPELPGIAAGVHHYLSRDHCLEQRAVVSADTWNASFGGHGFFVALCSIYWREAWKYGMRAFRYCQHDCGHAIAALAYAAAALGWRASRVDTIGDDDLARLLGLDRDTDFPAAEREAPDCLLWIDARGPAAAADGLLSCLRGATWQGHANRLSSEHRDWPEINAAHVACHKPATAPQALWSPAVRSAPTAPELDLSAAQVCRQRRSAVDFDGTTEMSAAAFFAMLDAAIPRADAPPWSAWRERPQVHLALYVHRVRDLQPGLYLLLRNAADRDEMRAAMRAEWVWQEVGTSHLPLYLLLPYDLRTVAKQTCCHQNIAADSCFSLGMIARTAGVAAQAWRYRQLYWECGMIGQTLYLEAEAAGIRATGIGCFFDDEVHQLLGLRNEDWQSLYHFTVGGPLDDGRLTTLPPYGPERPIDP